MYTIYQSPRRSPRHTLPQSNLNPNILKPKAIPAIRKQGPTQSSKNPPISASALAAVTRDGTQKRGQKKKINDENKENSNIDPKVPMTSGMGINGVASAKNAWPVHSKAKPRDKRIPLKELPLNGFVDRSRKRDIVPSVEIVSTAVPGRSETRPSTNTRERNRSQKDLDEGVGVGFDWDMMDIIR